MIKFLDLALTPDIPSLAREWRNSDEIRKFCRQYSLISEYSQTKWLEKIEADQSIKMFGINEADQRIL